MGELIKNQRIKILRQELWLDQLQFAKAIGMKQGSISDVERGKAQVSSTLISKLQTTFNINSEYILFGKAFLLFKTCEQQQPLIYIYLYRY